jgi:hypothetical protein
MRDEEFCGNCKEFSEVEERILNLEGREAIKSSREA